MKFKEVEYFMKDQLRKSNSLVASAKQIREDMKAAQGMYYDHISELAQLTKGELKKVITNLNGKYDEKIYNQAISIFDRLEETLFSMEDSQASMDELVSIIGGLEFSSESTTDKLLEILIEQEKQHHRMTKSVSLMNEELNKSKEENKPVDSQLLEDVQEFLHDFSIFQDYAIASVPKISQLFDELDKEEQIGKRYNENV